MRRAGDVVLRDVSEQDLPTFFDHQMDPDATRMAAFPARDREIFMAHWMKILGDDTVITQTIVYDGQVAGNVVSFAVSGQPHVGYWIGKDYWGKGIATRALSAFLNDVTVRPLYGRVARGNIASIRALEKCGFTVAGEEVAVPNGDDEIEEVILMLR